MSPACKDAHKQPRAETTQTERWFDSSQSLKKKTAGGDETVADSMKERSLTD